MSRKNGEDNTGMIVAGLAVLVIGAIGIGMMRRKPLAKTKPACKVVEDSVYRGFKYRIEECPVGATPSFMAIVPSQTVGNVTIATDEGDLLKSLDEARQHVRKLIDAKLAVPLKMVFVGANRP